MSCAYIVDHRFERRPVVGHLFERLVEEVDRATTIALLALHDADAEVSRAALGRHVVFVMNDEQVVILERVFPVFFLEIRERELVEHFDVRAVEPVRCRQRLDRAVKLAELHRDAAHHELQLQLLFGRTTRALANEHFSERLQRPPTAPSARSETPADTLRRRGRGLP